MAQLDKLILNALDAQRMNEANYSFVMSKLDSYDKKMEFLNFLNKNRNVILSKKDIFLELKEIAE